ncbi:MAG: MFS transporter [Kofleriaceae bacterium]|nr:MFS transporter [Kofleriaceae bacterium]
MTPTSAPDPRRWWALFLLCAAQFLVILDTSIVGIALPALQRALGFDAAGLQWIFNAYVVAFGGLLLLGGRLADLFGPRRLFATGFVVLTSASLVAGIATSGTTLLIARAVQGAGAALIAPAALSMVMGLFAARPSELRRALGFWGAAAAAGGTAGVFLGGVITEWLSWRWTFLINVPVGVLVLLATNAWLPRGARQRGSVDVAGATTITSALALTVYSIVTANEATGARTALLLTISVALFAAFGILQRKRSAPLVPLAIFRAPNLTAGNVVMALLGAAWIPMWFFLNMYLQEILGYGAFESGLALLPMTLAIMVLMMMVTEKVVGRIGPKAALVIGLGVLGIALVLFARMPLDGSFAADVLVPSLLGAIGMSLAYIPAMITSTATARPEEGGLASGLVNTTYQVGSALGLAAMVAVAGSKSSSLLSEGVEAAAAMNGGFSSAFIGAAFIALAATGAALIAIRVPRAMRAGAGLAMMLFIGIALGACSRTASSSDSHRTHGSATAADTPAAVHGPHDSTSADAGMPPAVSAGAAVPVVDAGTGLEVVANGDAGKAPSEARPRSAPTKKKRAAPGHAAPRPVQPPAVERAPHADHRGTAGSAQHPEHHDHHGH